MAWRIEDSVVKGEIDNRIRGVVTGTIWFAGKTEPMILRLSGNAWRDVAGRKLEFVNPEPSVSPVPRDGLVNQQDGTVGDITASRRVKMPDIPFEQIAEYYAAKKPFPWHWTNSLYLEWFSKVNGRIVIESTSYHLRFIGEPAWEMTPEEETLQHQANVAAISTFVERTGDPAYSQQSLTEDDGSEKFEVNEETDDAGLPRPTVRPLSEPEAESLQSDADWLLDRIQFRLQRDGESVPNERIIEEEIERLRRERVATGHVPETRLRQNQWLREMHRAGARALGKPDPDASFAHEHDLAKKAQDFAADLMRESTDYGWRPADGSEEHPMVELVNSLLKAGSRLADALNRSVWPPPPEACGSVIVRLNRARVYLDDAARAIEACQEQGLGKPHWLAASGGAIQYLARETDLIITELRSSLRRVIE